MASSTPSSELAGYGPPEDAAGAHALDGYGPPEPAEGAHADMSPEVRRIAGGGGMRSEAKSDEELGLDEGPKFSIEYPQFSKHLRGATGPVSGAIVPRAQDAPGTEAYASHHTGDEMRDTGAQMLTGAALASPGASLVGAIAPAAVSPLLSGAASGGQQAAFMGQDPGTGMVLGALPGVPKALGAAERAIGQAALNRATSPGFGEGPGPVARAAGKLTGMAVGGATHGPLGALVGHDLGGRAANMFSRASDAATRTLANRALRQEAARAAIAPNMVTLAPLEHQPLPEPTSVPNGALGTPFRDDFGNIVTDAKAANQMVNHGTVGGKTAVLPEKSFVESAVGRLKNGTSLADAVKAAEEEPSLREAVIRDAKKFRAEASPDVEEQPETDLAATMQRTIDILEKLKAAKAAGNLSDDMVQAAVDAGVTPALIKKVTGKR